ncbi:MAG: hypothetical protein K0R38_3487 [Polyangiaceae bacterium]|jgi:hypothetical protein|nr:hypothetical protein [Polyangiaceae bacterium]
MTSLEYFAAIAAEFCDWVEAKPGNPQEELAAARRLAARLYAAALDLPDGSADFAQQADDSSPRDAVFERFAALPINMYAVVDPLALPGTAPRIGDLADDFTDTYFDIRYGLRLYRSGLHVPAAWEWSFSFRTHWGDHLVGALSALQAFATRG